MTSRREPVRPTSAPRFDRVRRVRSFEEVVEQVRAAATVPTMDAGRMIGLGCAELTLRRLVVDWRLPPDDPHSGMAAY